MEYKKVQTRGAITIRAIKAKETQIDILCFYFVSNEGQVPWQDINFFDIK